MSSLSLIVAVDRSGVIGREGDLPWRLSADLKRFKKVTMGHHLLMGRKTFESIGRLLPGRATVVITRNRDYEAAGALIAFDVDQAIELAEGDDEPFLVGGEQIYRLALPKVTRIYRTLVAANVEGDAHFPELDERQWRIVSDEPHQADQKNEFDYRFQILDRVPPRFAAGRRPKT